MTSDEFDKWIKHFKLKLPDVASWAADTARRIGVDAREYIADWGKTLSSVPLDDAIAALDEIYESGGIGTTAHERSQTPVRVKYSAYEIARQREVHRPSTPVVRERSASGMVGWFKKCVEALDAAKEEGLDELDAVERAAAIAFEGVDVEPEESRYCTCNRGWLSVWHPKTMKNIRDMLQAEDLRRDQADGMELTERELGQLEVAPTRIVWITCAVVCTCHDADRIRATGRYTVYDPACMVIEDGTGSKRKCIDHVRQVIDQTFESGEFSDYNQGELFNATPELVT